MANLKPVKFLLEEEKWLELNRLASERGDSIHQYCKWLIIEGRDMATGLELLSSDLKDISFALEELNLGGNQEHSGGNFSERAIIEILLSLRKILQPNKMETVKKELNALGIERIDVREHQK